MYPPFINLYLRTLAIETRSLGALVERGLEVSDDRYSETLSQSATASSIQQWNQQLKSLKEKTDAWTSDLVAASSPSINRLGVEPEEGELEAMRATLLMWSKCLPDKAPNSP